MTRRVEYKGYQIDVEIADVTGADVVAIIKPVSDIAIAADARAMVGEKDNVIILKLKFAEDPVGSGFLEVGLRAAIIEIDIRLSRSDGQRTG